MERDKHTKLNLMLPLANEPIKSTQNNLSRLKASQQKKRNPLLCGRDTDPFVPLSCCNTLFVHWGPVKGNAARCVAGQVAYRAEASVAVA